MAYRKGQSGNPHGRPKGAQNKITKDLRNTIKHFLDRNIEHLQKDYDQLDPQERLIFMEKLLKYAIPTMTQSKIELERLTDEQLDEILNQVDDKLKHHEQD